MKAFVLLFFISSLAHGLDSIEKINEIKSGELTKLVLTSSGEISENPSIVRKKTSVDVLVPGTKLGKKSAIHVNPKYGVKITSDSKGTNISIPRSSLQKSKVSQVSVKLSRKSLTVILPLVAKKNAVTKKASPKPVKVVEASNKAPEAKKSNLDYLIEDFRRTADNQEKIPFNEDRANELLEDKVVTKQTAQVKTEVVATNSETMKIDDLKDETKGIQSYLIKLVLVLGVIIGGFLLVINLFRKKVLGKNKLGFLNNSKLVEVVGTTHIAPKKNLLLVRVHDQYLLLSNTDTGINFLTEIKDQAGLLRMGEKEALGSNFDASMEKTQTTAPATIVEKKNIYESTGTSSKQSSFSKHLKRKLKKSKSVESRA